MLVDLLQYLQSFRSRSRKECIRFRCACLLIENKGLHAGTKRRQKRMRRRHDEKEDGSCRRFFEDLQERVLGIRRHPRCEDREDTAFARKRPTLRTVAQLARIVDAEAAIATQVKVGIAAFDDTLFLKPVDEIFQ